MYFLYKIFRRWMSGIEEKMICRLLRQRNDAWEQIDNFILNGNLLEKKW